LITYYTDADGDGFGSASDPGQTSCTLVSGKVTNNGDCDDSNPAINPGATEVCNGIDDDCDGSADEGLPFLTYYTDADGDGYGSASATGTSSCSPIAGSVTNNSDCNDGNAAVNSAASEICGNGIDDNCNGQIDENNPVVSAGSNQTVAQNSGNLNLTGSPSGGTWSGTGVSASGVFNTSQTPGAYVLTYAIGSPCPGSATVTITINPVVSLQAEPVTFSPGTGTYTAAQTITMSSATPEAVIFYTTNGNLPRVDIPNSFTFRYAGPILIGSSCRINAMATKAGMSNSAVRSINLTFTAPAVVATPAISPGTGSYTGAQSVSITCATPGSSIYYTTNGNVPLLGSVYTFLYTGPFAVNSTATIRAMGTASGMVNSANAVATLTITSPPAVVATPVITPGSGSFGSPLSVSISCATPGATIYYTTNGSVPRLSPFPNSFTRIYGSPFSLTGAGSRTIRAVATLPGSLNSAVAVANLTLIPGTRAAFGNEEEEEISAQEIRVYPNPSSGMFQVQVPEGESSMNYSLWSTDGRQLASGTLRPGQTEALDLSGRPAGLYTLKTEGENGTRVFRLSKL
jgi:hypothetical protein